MSYDFSVNFLCRQLFSSLYFKRDSIWIIIILSLSFPPSVCSQPQSHFNSSLLSPIQRADFLLMQSLNEDALFLYQSLIIKDGTSGYAFRGLVRAYKGMVKTKIVHFLIKQSSRSGISKKDSYLLIYSSL